MRGYRYDLVDMKANTHIGLTHDEMSQFFRLHPLFSSFPCKIVAAYNVRLIYQDGMEDFNRHVLQLLTGIRNLGFHLVLNAGHGVATCIPLYDLGESRNIVIAIMRVIKKDGCAPRLDYGLCKDVNELPRDIYNVVGLVPVNDDDDADAFRVPAYAFRSSQSLLVTPIDVRRGMEQTSVLLELLCQAKRTSHASAELRPV
jgi:hypothetical protein